MLDSALYFRLAFQQFGSVDANFKWCLSDVEWERVRRISRFLKPFYEITTLFSGSQYPTANLYFNGVWKIEWLIRQEMACLDEGISSMSREMMQKFAKYWKCYSMVLSFAIILDPRFKLDYVTFLLGKLHSNVERNQHVDKIRSEFKRLFDDYYRAPFNSPCGPSTCGDDDDEVSEFENVHRQSRRSESEFDMYLNDARLSSKQELDVLRYWRDKSSQYPTLAVMARDILFIPITTVASESTFSIGGRIIGKFRSSLLPDTAKALLCTRDWLFGVDASQDSAEQVSLMIDFAPFVAQLDTSARV